MSFNNLKSWIIKNGGSVSDKIRLNDNSVNRSIYAVDDISVGEDVMIIPKKLFITEEGIDREGLDKSQKVMFRLIKEIELGELSFYHPFIMMLPKPSYFENHPLNCKYNRKNLAQLCSFFLKRLELHQEKIDDFISKMGSLGYNDYQYLKYIYLIFVTRNYDGELIPLADLLQNKTNSQYHVDMTHDAVFKHTKLIKTNTELTIPYHGRYQSDIFSILCDYGYLDRDSIIPIKINMYDTNQEKLFYLSKEGYDPYLYQHLYAYLLKENNYKKEKTHYEVLQNIKTLVKHFKINLKLPTFYKSDSKLTQMIIEAITTYIEILDSCLNIINMML